MTDVMWRLRSLLRSPAAAQREQFPLIAAEALASGCTSGEAAAILAVALTCDFPLQDHVTAQLRAMRDVYH